MNGDANGLKDRRRPSAALIGLILGVLLQLITFAFAVGIMYERQQGQAERIDRLERANDSKQK